MIGLTVSHYEIVEQLGGGGMGIVYRARDTSLERSVALKFLPPEWSRDPEAKQRFVTEARAASALEHDSICSIHEIDETEDGQLFIVMPAYDGETLKQKLASGPLPLAEAIDIITQLAEGLSKAHEHGIVHRDIKPANVLVTSAGSVKILDFGLAKLVHQTSLTKPGTVMGTVAYMSPEQTRGEEVDERSDIWSAGVVLYEMLSGQLPFRGDSEPIIFLSILEREPMPIGEICPELPGDLQAVVERALTKSLNQRYERVEGLLGDLRRLEDDSEAPTRRHRVPREGLAKSTRSVGTAVRKPALLAVLVLAAFLAATWALFAYLEILTATARSELERLQKEESAGIESPGAVEAFPARRMKLCNFLDDHLLISWIGVHYFGQGEGVPTGVQTFDSAYHGYEPLDIAPGEMVTLSFSGPQLLHDPGGDYEGEKVVWDGSTTFASLAVHSRGKEHLLAIDYTELEGPCYAVALD